eukprot:Selendium_serpulae@DN4256_c2_g2_i2.p1
MPELGNLMLLVQQLQQNKEELDRQLKAAHEALVAAVRQLVGQVKSSNAMDDFLIPDRPAPPPMPQSRRHSRAIRFGKPPPEEKCDTPPQRRSRRGTIEGGQSLGNRPIVARTMGPRLGQPMRHKKGPNN